MVYLKSIPIYQLVLWNPKWRKNSILFFSHRCCSFIEEGTPDFTPDGLLNFSKMRMVCINFLTLTEHEYQYTWNMNREQFTIGYLSIFFLLSEQNILLLLTVIRLNISMIPMRIHYTKGTKNSNIGWDLCVW